MSLLGGQNAAGAAAETDEEKKARKNESSRRFKEKQAAIAKERQQNALALQDELKKFGVYDQLSSGSKTLIYTLCQDPASKAAVSSGSSILETLFGPTPKVGDSISLLEVFQKTEKGRSTMDILLRRWAGKGIEIEYQPSSAGMAQGTYTIKALPNVM